MTFLIKKGKAARRISLLAAIVLLAAAACALYLGDFYRADMDAVEAFGSTAEMQLAENGSIIWEVEDASSGFIFYPGGKVEHTAYIPLMKALASEGILCVLVEMPFHLAVFDIDAADGIQEEYPQIENWYIGHRSRDDRQKRPAVPLRRHERSGKGDIQRGGTHRKVR